MDKKGYAAIVVVIIVIVAIAAAVVLSQNDGEDDRDVSVIGRVNTDGSGLFLNAGENPDEYLDIITDATAEDEPEGPHLGGQNVDGTYTWVEFYPEAWGGKIFGDPGAATIQHVQLNQIADAMGLEFVQYQNGAALNSNTIYYVPNVSTYILYESTLLNTPMTGAIMWEAQYSVAMEDQCVGLVTTNDLFPGHTCCIIGASHEYISSHEDETVRFLAGYVQSVQEMTAAIASESGEAYDEVMSIALNNVTMPDTMTDEQKRAAIASAWEIVNYTYADQVPTNQDPLAVLKQDMAELAEDFVNVGTVSTDAAGLGFDSYEAMAEKLVQSQYMQQALSYEKQDTYETADITVAVLGGDIHQLAIHYGIQTGIFAEYGIHITISSQQNGPAAFTAIANGNAQFAFLGAPPMTINAMNGGYITPDN